MTKSPHVEIYYDDFGWFRWRFRSSNGKVLSQSSEGYIEPRSLVRALELSHPGYTLRDAGQGLTGYGGWYLWPLHNTAETPAIPVRVPSGTVKLWRARRKR